MGCGFFVLFVGLLALVGGVGVLVWLGGRKVVAHLRQEPQALPATFLLPVNQALDRRAGDHDE